LRRTSAVRPCGNRRFRGCHADDFLSLDSTPDKGYGFIAPDGGGEDSFVHISAVQAAGMATLNKEQRVSYEVETGRNGKKSAVNLTGA
jgi:CspA family cold shock protein